MKINPYLNFNGHCEAAFNFYAQCLGGKIDGMLRCGESPVADKMPKDMQDKIMHVQMTVGDNVIMGSDTPSEYFEKPSGFAVTLNISDPTEAERVFNGLAQGGLVKMALQKTFWADRFGMLVDQFGTPWMVNCIESPA